MIPNSPPTVCGTVRTAGSEMSTVVYLRAGEREYALLGPHSTELLGYDGRVCVTVGAVIRVPPYGETLKIDGYRLEGDGRHAPIVGVLGMLQRDFVLADDRGRRFVLGDHPSSFRSLIGCRLFAYVEWKTGRFDVLRFGVLGEPRCPTAINR
jgi:hypothetical protein